MQAIGFGLPSERFSVYFSKAIAARTNSYVLNQSAYLVDQYNERKGFAQDFYEAARWFRKAADQGDADAQFHLGSMYMHGRGVKQYYKEASRWYLKAADQGNAGAQYNIGLMYKQGRGVKQDEKKALRWLLKAAEQGHIEARAFLNTS